MTDKDLMLAAKKVSERAHAPHTGFSVGAAVLFSDGEVFCGCNVETFGYGSSLCAERNAIAAAVASGHSKGIVKIAVYSPHSSDVLPCGSCRQWITEFTDNDDIEIITEAEDGSIIKYSMKDLLPYPYRN